MLNRVELIGNLGAVPDVRSNSEGKRVVSFSMATNEYYTDKDGNKAARTEWHYVTVPERQADLCLEALKKGSRVYVEGKIAYWKSGQNDKAGIVARNVLFLDRKETHAQV